MPNKRHLADIEKKGGVRITRRGPLLGTEASLTAVAIEALIREGVINPTGKSDMQIREETIQLLKSGAVRFQPVADYRFDLLDAARLAKRRGEAWLACLLYATWVEHFVNMVVSHYARRKRASVEQIVEMIRHVNLPGKVSWLLPILEAPAIPKRHVGALMAMAESRNQFVHYKWKPTDWEALPASDAQVEKRVSEIEKTVRYLQSYEARHVARGGSKTAERLVTARPRK